MESREWSSNAGNHPCFVRSSTEYGNRFGRATSSRILCSLCGAILRILQLLRRVVQSEFVDALAELKQWLIARANAYRTRLSDD